MDEHAAGPRAEGYPHLTSQRHWKNYAFGMLTETLFVLTLTAVGFLLAVIALAIWS